MGAVLVAAATLDLAYRSFAYARLDSESPQVTTSSDDYQPFGTEPHSGPIRQLAPGEKADPKRAYFRILVTRHVRKVGVLDEFGTILWEQANPPQGAIYRFDVPVGRYFYLQLHDPSQPGSYDAEPFELTEGGMKKVLTSSHPLGAPRRPWVTVHRKE